MLQTCSTFHFIQFKTVTHSAIYLAHDVVQYVAEPILTYILRCVSAQLRDFT